MNRIFLGISICLTALAVAGLSAYCVIRQGANPLPATKAKPVWSQIATASFHSVALKTDGTLWAWGDNTNCMLGLRRYVISRTSPTLIKIGADWKQVSCRNAFTLAIKNDGALWAWGAGALGSREAMFNGYPAQVGTDKDWKQAACGGAIGNWNHAIALKTDGSLWSWGSNKYYQLGIGENKGDSDSPVRVGTDTDWAQIACGGSHNLAIKTNGTLWVWGINYYEFLKLDEALRRSRPVQVGTDTDWKFVIAGEHYSMAIKTNGALWAWGSNHFSELGLGDELMRRSPVQVGTDRDWKQAACGYAHTVAIKTDGSLWAWGRWALGLGENISANYPTQVGTDKDWAQVDCGRPTYPAGGHTIALKTDGTLWAWGDNACGQLGLGNTADRTIPTKVRQ